MAADRGGPAIQTGTRTLRWVVAGTAGALLAVVVGFVIVGKLTMRNYLTNLPKHLGVDIQQESNSFTYSQSSKGRKIFTVHASKEVQRKDGKIDLHDVGIVLYGPTGAETDRIHGADFEYDQKAELMTAQGEVYIDLVPPAKESDSATSASPEARMIHVKTIGLFFDQKAQTATTGGRVEFRTQAYSGTSIGASYCAQDGVVVLNSDVHLTGLRGVGSGAEHPVRLTASRAEMDRGTEVVDLAHAKYVTSAESGPKSFAAIHAIVHLAPDGTPQRIDAAGDVELASDARGSLHAQQMQMELGPTGQPRNAHFENDVKYSSDENGVSDLVASDDARMAFDPAGRPIHALMQGKAWFQQQGPASLRRLDAPTIELSLAGGGKEPTAIRAAEAFGPGGASLQLADDTTKGRTSTHVKADRLTGRFATASAMTELTGVDGTGHTWVQRVALSPAGVQQSKDTSTGEVLRVDFKPADKGRSVLTRAEQSGSVVTLHEALATSGPKKGQPEAEHGRADDSVYEAETNLVHMTGHVEVQNETSALFADKVDVDRNKGESTATGSVRVAYASEPAPGKTAQEPVHILASRGIAHKETGVAEFFADGNGRVRMWQGSSQVEAPEIDLFQKEKRAEAHGAGSGSGSGSDAAAVRTVLVSDGSTAGSPKKPGGGGPVRVLSRSMVYTDANRTVEFTGGVRLVDQDGTMTSQQATVFLTSSGPSPATAPAAEGMFSGKVDHIVATGNVVIDQPGRKGTGEKLVYTADDGVFLLTGTPAVPPRVVDQAEGTTTGAALKFHRDDNSVVVLGSLDEKKPGRVRTETRMNHQ